MEIILDIKKKHLVFFSIFLILFSAGFVIAQGSWDSSKPSHETLYTDEIVPKTDGERISVHNGFNFEPRGNICSGNNCILVEELIEGCN